MSLYQTKTTPKSHRIHKGNEGNHHLRSDDFSLLQIPKTNSKTLGDRSFKHAAPLIWNYLPLNIRRCETVNCFKTHLKTFVLRKAYK